MTATTRLALTPRDGLFCKDGRGWHTSASGRGHGLDWPWPSTVLGALRSAWGRGEEQRTASRFDSGDWRARTASIGLGRTLVLRRPLLPTQAWGPAHRVWPVPADALWLEGHVEVYRLDPAPPRSPTLGRDDDDAREALWVPRVADAAKPLGAPRWWSEDLFASWLAGSSVPATAPGRAFETHRRVQAHVGIRPDEHTADEGVLFSHDVVETFDGSAEWAMGVEVALPSALTPSVATLGSDSRLVRVDALTEQAFEPSGSVLQAFSRASSGLRLVVTSPAWFGRGWLPDGFERSDREYRGRLAGLEADLVLRAAFVPRPLHVSGWDMAAGAPKATSRVVPAGAVYFFERLDGRPFGEIDARGLWLAPFGARTDEGFGRVVPGTWNPTRG